MNGTSGAALMRTPTRSQLRIIYIWLAALAAACLLSAVAVSSANAALDKLNYAGLFANRNAGASSNYTMAATLHFNNQNDSNAAIGDDIKKLVFDWPSGMTGIPTQIPAADRCDQGDPSTVPLGSIGQSPNYGNCATASPNSQIGTIEVDVRVHIANFFAQLAGCGDLDMTLAGSLYLLKNYPASPEVPTYIGIAISGSPSGLCGLAGAQTMNMTAKITVRPDDQGLRIQMIDGMPRTKDTGTFGTADLRVKAIRQMALGTTPGGKPFLRNPTRCVASSGVPEMDRWRSIVYAQSYDGNNAGNLPPGTSLVTIGGETYVKVPNVQDTIPQCGGQSQNDPAFAPNITIVNKSTQAGAPTGVLATVTNTAELNNPNIRQTSHIKKMSMAMPTGFRVNPAIAERLQNPIDSSEKRGCSEAEFNKANPEEDPTGAGKCPGWSQIGTVAVQVPEITGDLTGRMFLGQPQAGDMQAPSLVDPNRRAIFRLYMWARRGGVNVKFEGRARVNQTVGDPNYGQIAVEFGDPSYSPTLAPGLSQFDFTKFILDFDSGSPGVGSPSSGAIWGADPDRQMMMNPQVCGTYSMETTFTPWTSPTQGDTVRQGSLTVGPGPNGSCGYRTFAQDTVTNPFAVEDGVGSVSGTGLGFGVKLTTDYDQTVAPSDPNSLKNATTISGVGRHPTMTFKVTRPDRMDNISQMRFVMPEGFGGSIKATSNSCSVATLNSIAAGSGGACPADAKVGDVSVDTGAGPANKMLRIFGNNSNGGGVFIMDRHDYAAHPEDAVGMDASMAGVNELTKYTAKLAIVTPAVVGPFNLGAVVNKLYMRLASSTKFQLSAETGGAGLDQSIRGIPVLYRAITIKMQGINTQGTPSTADDRPFLFLPSKCASSLKFTGTITSVGSPPSAGPETTTVESTPSGAPVTTGCPAQTFAPTVQVTGLATTPATPTGMSTKVSVPQIETGVTTSTVQQSTINRVRIQFPPGVEMNPAVATNLEACPTASIDADVANPDADTNRCQANYPKSKLGDVFVNTPLLPELPGKDYGVDGAMYLEQQGSTKENRMRFVLYLAMPGGMQIVRGGAVIAGSTDGPTAGLGSTTETPAPGSISTSVIDGTALQGGQIEADFSGLPDVSYRWMRLDFAGAKAPDDHIVPMFVTPDPATCPQVNNTKVRVNATNTNGTTVPASSPANVFFNTPGDPNLSFTTNSDGSHPCRPTQAFTPSADIQVTANSRTPDPTRATAHPDMKASILRSDMQKDLKRVIFHLPPGMSGAPTATVKCPLANANAGNCTPASVIGNVEVELGSGADTIVINNGKIYNTVPADANEPARLTTIVTVALGPFDLGKMSLPILTSLRAGDAGLDADVTLPQRFEGIRTHYRRLSMIMNGYADQGTPDPSDDKPFLSNPSKCQLNTILLDAWAADGTQAPSPQSSFTTTGCPMEFPAGALPTMTMSPTSTDSESPTGLNITMTNGNATSFNPTVKKVQIEFPQGMTVNPAVGNDGNNAVCSTALINAGGAGCPIESRRGDVHIQTPLLAGTYDGYVYLEQQGATKDDRFRLALVIQLPGQKLIIRGNTQINGASDLAGPTGAVNTGTGVITAVFDNMVDLPFYSMTMALYGGPHALLVNPSTCGSAVMKGAIAPNSGTVGAELPVTTYSSYNVTGCMSAPPNPTFNASLSPAHAGDNPNLSAGHPNFNLTVGNLGKSPQLSSFDLDLPPGFVADTVATPRCTQANALIGACADNTVIGSVTTTMGSPTETLNLPGKLYNVEPDTNDQPARLQAILNVVVGPFNLGKLSIPVITTMRSDYGITTHTELPYRYEGIDVFVRQLTLTVNGWSDLGTPAPGDDKPFMINPTECGTMPIVARITRRSGPPVAPISSNITINGCPRAFTILPPATDGLSLKVTPATTETGVPTPLTFEVGNSIENPTLKKIEMTMPLGMELNPAVGNGLVTCPSAEVNNHGGAACVNTTANVGSVSLTTPLLPVPQTGNVFIEDPIGNDKDTRYRVAIVVHLPGKDLISRGKVSIDGSSTIVTGGTGRVDNGTGQMSTVFYGENVGSDLPDLAFSKMTVNFNGGPLGRPMFTNPRSCTTAQFTATITPHGGAGPQALSDSYATTSDCGAPGFNPTFTGGVSNPASAANPNLTMTATTPAKDNNIKQFDIDLPTGLVAATGNVPLCSKTQADQGNCDSSSDIGNVSASIGTSDTLADDYTITGDLYNVAPLPGEPARLAAGINVVVGPYNLGKLTLPITAVLRSDWGVTTHTTLPSRYEGIAVRMRSMSITLASQVGGKPFTINPSKCQSNTVTARMASDGAPVQNKTASWSYNTNNCVGLGVLAAPPSIAVSPSTTQAGSPVGLRIDVNSPEGNPTIKRTQFTFPQGLEINAAFAKDLDPCPTVEINDAIANTGNRCASHTKIADVTMTTSLMSSRPQGRLYLESPGLTKDDRYRVALILDLPGRTLVVRGAISINGTTTIASGATGSVDQGNGQMSADFDNIPDLGFTQLRLDFVAGSKAMMVNPTTCTPHTFTGVFTPNSATGTTSTATTNYTPTGCGASFAPSFTAAVSSTQSAGHPDLTLHVLNAANQQELRKLTVKLPVGLVANTTATPTRCSQVNAGNANCLPSQVVGDFSTSIGSTDAFGAVDDRVTLTGGKIYNVVPSSNEPARMQAVMAVVVGPFDLGKLTLPVTTKLNPDMSVDAVTTIPMRYEGIAVKVREMNMKLNGVVGGNDFMVNPSRCATHTISGVMESTEGLTRTGNSSFATTGCAPVASAYNPSVSFTNSPQTAGAPTALGVNLTVPASSSTTSNVKMTFPAGFEISPGAGTGLVACTTIDSDAGASCVSTTAKLADVTLTTPLLPTAQLGELFLEPSIGRYAASRFRLAMVVHLPGQNLIIRGGTLVDGSSDLINNLGSKNTGDGHVTASFPGLPDLGFTNMQLDFNGAKKLFVNPKTAGSFNIQTELTPHAGAAPVMRSGSISTSGGTSGVNSFAPTFTGSLTLPSSPNPATTGSNPDLKLQIGNPDGMNEIEKLAITLPEGLVARTQGVPQCQLGDAQTGNCAAASKVGSVTTTIGSFGETLSIAGDIVNVVPAANQPARMYAMVPVHVGPFDLGNLTVDVPTKLNSDLTVTATTQLPKRYEGIAVRVRQLDMTIQGQPAGGSFMVAPSKCGNGTVSAEFTSNLGTTASGSFSYNVGGCPRNWVTAPSMTVTANPAVRNAPVNLTFALHTDANNPTIKSMHVALPDNTEINPAFGDSVAVCSPSLVDAGGAGCPAASKIGVVKIRTALLDPTHDYLGEVYLEPQGSTAATRFKIAIVAHLPGADLVVRGKITVVGSTDITGGTGSTTYAGPGKILADFDTIPDLGFTDLDVIFNTSRPMLVNAPEGGTQTLAVDVTPHSGGTTANLAPTYFTTGGATPAPFNPTFVAQVSDSTAAAHPNLTLKVDRTNNNSESIKNFDLSLPPGLVANTLAAPTCSEASANAGGCLPASRVGSFTTRFGNGATSNEDLTLGGDIYNVTAHPDEPARMSALVNVLVGPFDLGKLPIPITTALRADTGIDTTTQLPVRYEGIAVRIKQMNITLFGMADQGTLGNTADDKPFMQNPSKCGNNSIRATITSASGADTLVKQSSFTTTGCPIGFNSPPTVTAAVTPSETSVPTSLGVEIGSAADNPTIGKIAVKLPLGMSVNAAVGNGLATCSTAQLNSDHTGCPVASLQGTAEVESPLLAGTFNGYVYLEDPLGNDATTRYRLAIAVELPGRTIVVRGRVLIDGSSTIPTGGTGSVDTGTGQITTSFDAVPDLSFSRFAIDFNTGPRALLTNPDTCGSHTIESTITPSSGGAAQAAVVNSVFSTSFDGAGAPCPAEQPFAPNFSASAASHVSGANTDLDLTVDSGAKDQQIRDFTVHLPVGLVADTDATTHCTQTDAAAANCGAGSLVGSVQTKLGTGSETLDVAGSIYNVDPNSNEPARLAAIMPVVVGPYDLGKLSIPVSTFLRPGDYGVDAHAQIPLRYEGVTVRIHQMAMHMLGQASGNGFIKNPSKCTAGTNAITATMVSGSGKTVTDSDNYAVTGCPKDFVSAPTVAISGMNGEVEQPTGLTMDINSADDNPTIGSVKTTMPEGLTLNPAVGNVVDACSTAEIDAGGDNCPAASAIGSAELETPLLPGTHLGKVYLETPGTTAGTRYKLAVVIDLPGTNVVVRGVTTVDGTSDLTNGMGSTAEAGVTGRVVADFQSIPDLNFSHMRIKFDNGPNALLANAGTCGPQTIGVDMTPQSGGAMVSASDSYTLSYDGAGAPCPGTKSFNPTFSASLSTTQAAGNPNLTLSVSRQDKTQQLKEFNLQLPPGLVADTVHTPRCSVADSLTASCAANTVVGQVAASIGTGSNLLTMNGTVNNVMPVDPNNEPARMAVAFDVQVGPYNLGKLSIPVTTELVTGAQPSDLAINTHTVIPQRYEGVPVRMRSMQIVLNGVVAGNPFMINPSKCGTHTLGAEMKSDEGQTATGSYTFTTSGCPAQFNPAIDTTIPTGETGIPTGFSFGINVPANSSSIQAVTTTLPQGFEINPGVANRGGANALQACSTADIDAGGGACPASSQIGSVTLDTPLLPTQRTGHVYLETPGTTPSTRYKLAIVIDLPGPDLIVHGQAHVNGEGGGVGAGSGQVSAVFNNLPDIQFSNMTVNFDAGDHAMLTSPKTCGNFTSSAQLTPWSIANGQNLEDAAVTRTDDVAVNSDCGAASNFNPSFSASLANTDQAASSDLTLDVTAGAKDARINKLTIGLPVGLVANTTAATQCAENVANVGGCLPASKIGELTTSVGAGGDPLEMSGEIFNVAPHADEPARMAAAVNVLVGPYDLGKLVIPVSTKIRPGNDPDVNRRYGIDAVTDVPTRFDGVAIQLRTMSMTMYGQVGPNRFMVNPSKCGAHPITAELNGQGGASATLSDNITIGNCASGFATTPSISASVDPTETAVPTNFSLAFTSDAANQTIGSMATAMPEGMTINPAFGNGFGTTTETCPTASISAADFSNCANAQIGTVSLVTPLLPGVQSGKVYLEEPGGTAATRYRLAIAVTIPGQTLVVRGNVNVDGSTDLTNGIGSTDSNATGQMTATFDNIPDLGFTNMTVAFDTGERSLLTNPETCGPQTVEATVMPTDGSVAAQPSGTFVTSYDGAGAPCPAPASEGFAPNFNATFSTGTAAGNPDVTLTITRQDKTQQIKDLDLELPPGLVANTVATPRCSQADAALANCAAATEVGTVTTNVGTGDETLALSGGIYNVQTTGDDEPARMQAVVGVNVGPYNLGKLSVPVTTQIVGSTADTLHILTHTELPARYEGIPVRVRQMQIQLRGTVNGHPFMINPSKCDTHTISAHMTSTLGTASTASASFTTDNCASATYAPNLSADLIPDSRAGKPVGLDLGFGFTGVSSSTKSIKTLLPVGFGINPGIGRLGEGGAQMTCDAATIDTLPSNPNACPANSIIGTVKLDTPLLPTQRTGKVILESPDGSGSAATRYKIAVFVDLPGSGDLVVHGSVTVNGSTDVTPGATGELGSVDTGNGQVIATFDNLPDLQFSNMQVTFNTTGSGKHALMVAPETCGSYIVRAQMVSWSRPTAAAVEAADSVTVNNCNGPEGPLALSASTSTLGVGEHADMTMNLTRPDGNRSILATKFELPKGLVGSADAAPTCLDDASNAQVGNCPDASKVGEVTLNIGSSEDTYEMAGSIYNVVAPSDRPAKLVFAAHVVVGPYDLGNVVVPIDVNIDPNEYFLWAQTGNMPQRFEGIPVRISSIGIKLFGMADQGTPSTGDDKPFMSNPRSCTTLQIKGQVKFATGSSNWVDLTPANVGPFTGCAGLNLNDNAISIVNYNDQSYNSQPLDRVPEAPTKLRVNVTQGTATTQAGMKDMSMSLPGFRISAASANGSRTCSQAQLDANTTKAISDPDACPSESRIGKVWLDSSLLPKNVTDPDGQVAGTHSLWGYLYLTTPGTSAGDRYKLAIQLTGKTAITIKGTAIVDENPASATYGDMVTEFKDLPDIPFEEMQVDLTGIDVGSGIKPMLLNPVNTDTSNPKTITGAGAAMTAWSDPGTVVNKLSTTPVTVLAGTAKDFTPVTSDDISTYQSGAHPNVKFTYTRDDGQEDIRNVKMSLPAGFLGSAAAVPLCSLTDSAAGNCSSQSQIGTVKVWVGQFGQVLPLTGAVYMTDGVGGDIAGMSIKVLAKAGDYDLGSYISQGRVKIREADHGIDVDFADIPMMFKGVPTHMSKMEVDIPGVAQSTNNPVMFNASSCSPLTITSTITAWNNPATTTTQNLPYTATGCAARTFSPHLSFAAHGGGVGDPPAWTIKMGSNLGDSTLEGTVVTLPTAITINVAGIGLACTIEQAQARACLDSARIGTVSIVTPLLTTPVTGTVYMAKTTGGGSLPDMLLEIPEPINMQIRGVNRFVGASFNQVQSTFTGLPDMIFSEMTMNIAGGPNGLIMLRSNGVCGAATSHFSSHAGQQSDVAAQITGIEGFCATQQQACVTPKVSVSTKGAKKNKYKKTQTALSFSVGDNCKDIKSVKVTYPKGSKFNKKLSTYNPKKKATKKYRKNITGKAGLKGLTAESFKVSKNSLQFKAPFPAGSRSFSVKTKNSALGLNYKTFCGNIKKGKKYKKALTKCQKKLVTIRFEVTNTDGSVFKYDYKVPAGSKFFK